MFWKIQAYFEELMIEHHLHIFRNKETEASFASVSYTCLWIIGIYSTDSLKLNPKNSYALLLNIRINYLIKGIGCITNIPYSQDHVIAFTIFWNIDCFV